MKLSSLSIKTYRTIDSLDLSFPVSYAALCGPNDSGKTNVIRAIRAMMKDEDEGPFFPGEDVGITVKDDFPKWLDTPEEQRSISISLKLDINPQKDAGLYPFLLRQLQIEGTDTELKLRMDATYGADKQAPKVSVSCNEKTFDGLEAQEVFKKFQTSRSILFHNSPLSELTRLRYREGFGQLRELSGEGAAAVAKLKKDMDKGLQKIAKNQRRYCAPAAWRGHELRSKPRSHSRLWRSVGTAACSQPAPLRTHDERLQHIRRWRVHVGA